MDKIDEARVHAQADVELARLTALALTDEGFMAAFSDVAISCTALLKLVKHLGGNEQVTMVQSLLVKTITGVTEEMTKS